MEKEDFLKSEFFERLEKCGFKPKVSQADYKYVQVKIQTRFDNSAEVSFYMDGSKELNGENVRSMRTFNRYAEKFNHYAAGPDWKVPWKSQRDYIRDNRNKRLALFTYDKEGRGCVELSSTTPTVCPAIDVSVHFDKTDPNQTMGFTQNIVQELSGVAKIYEECEKVVPFSLKQSLEISQRNNEDKRETIAYMKNMSKDVEPFVYNKYNSPIDNPIPLSVYLEIAKQDSAYIEGMCFTKNLGYPSPEEIVILGRLDGEVVNVRAEVPISEPLARATKECDDIISAMKRRYPKYNPRISANDQAYINAHIKCGEDRRPSAPEGALNSASYRIVDSNHKNIPHGKDEMSAFIKAIKNKAKEHTRAEVNETKDANISI